MGPDFFKKPKFSETRKVEPNESKNIMHTKFENLRSEKWRSTTLRSEKWRSSTVRSETLRSVTLGRAATLGASRKVMGDGNGGFGFGTKNTNITCQKSVS